MSLQCMSMRLLCRRWAVAWPVCSSWHQRPRKPSISSISENTPQHVVHSISMLSHAQVQNLKEHFACREDSSGLARMPIVAPAPLQGHEPIALPGRASHSQSPQHLEAFPSSSSASKAACSIMNTTAALPHGPQQPEVYGVPVTVPPSASHTAEVESSRASLLGVASDSDRSIAQGTDSSLAIQRNAVKEAGGVAATSVLSANSPGQSVSADLSEGLDKTPRGPSGAAGQGRRRGEGLNADDDTWLLDGSTPNAKQRMRSVSLLSVSVLFRVLGQESCEFQSHKLWLLLCLRVAILFNFPYFLCLLACSLRAPS